MGNDCLNCVKWLGVAGTDCVRCEVFSEGENPSQWEGDGIFYVEDECEYEGLSGVRGRGVCIKGEGFPIYADGGREGALC